MVLTTPLIRVLRETYPDAYLAALVRPYTRAVLENNPHLDRIVLDEPDGRDRGVLGFWSLVSRIRAERFGISLMLLPTLRHALLTLLAGIPTRVGVGRKPYEVLTGTRPGGRNRDRPVRHEADYCLDLARAIGVDACDLRPEVFLTEEEKAAARRTLEGGGIRGGRVVGVHPGSGGSAPNWTVQTYAALVTGLVRELDARVVVTGDRADARALGDAGFAESEGVLDLTGRVGLRELAAVISTWDVLVSSSTGPMHVAAALGVACVALFCPRAACCPVRWGPLGEGHRVFLPGGARCEGCGPVRDPDCRLEEISVEQVLASVASVLARS